MKKVSVLFLALMMSTGVQANDALKTVADTVKSVFGNKSINVNVAAGDIEGGSIKAKALARENSTAAAGGIIASQKKGPEFVGVNTALGRVKNVNITEATAEAYNGSQAYSGGIVAGQH